MQQISPLVIGVYFDTAQLPITMEAAMRGVYWA